MARGAINTSYEDRPGSRHLSVLLHLWPFLSPYRWQILGAMGALALAAGTVLAMGLGVRKLVDEGFGGQDAALLDRAVLVLFAVVALLAFSSFARFYLVSWVGERVVADLRRRVFDHVMTLSPAYFEVTRTGEIMSRLTTDTTLLQATVGVTATTALRNVLMLIGGVVLLFVTSAKLTALVLLVVPLVLLPILFFGRRVRRLSRDTQDRVADIGAYVDETLGAIRTLQAFGHESEDSRRFSVRVEEAFQTACRRVRARALLTALVMLLVFGAVSIILWIGGHDMLQGRITAGDLSAFVFYAVLVASSAGVLSEVVGELQRAAGAVERLLGLLQTVPEIAAPAQPKALPQPAKGAVRFDDVIFRYPARQTVSALDALSFTVAPGETLAIVGPSGAGKTTIFQLLLRFYDPQAGRITLDGIGLGELAPADLRAHIGLVPQEPVIFSGDAWENIRYGKVDASDEAVRAAAKAAAALDFLEALPQGLDTFLGQKGIKLSGGQRQRIAIARAILRDPTLLLLDEATSALDAESERAVQEALDHLMADRTTLIIAHRLATVQKADRILVLDQGRLVASGTHSELVAQGGLYARLAALQFSRPEDEVPTQPPEQLSAE